MTTSLQEVLTEVSDRISLKSLECGSGANNLLFIPGWTMPSEVWSPLLTRLSSHFKVISLTMRSHPGSTIAKDGNTLSQYAVDIRNFLRKRSIEKCHLIGWSMGVSVVFEYIKAFGDSELNSAILIDGSRFGAVTEDWPHGTRSEKYLLFCKQMTEDRKLFTKNFVSSMFLKEQPTEYLEKLENLASTVPVDTAISLLVQILNTDYRDVIPQIKCRTLTMVCEKNEAAAQWAHDRLKKSELKVFKNIGHAMFQDAPEEFFTTLMSFLKNEKQR